MEAAISSETHKFLSNYMVPYPRGRCFHVETVPDPSRLPLPHVHSMNLIKDGATASLTVQVSLYCECHSENVGQASMTNNVCSN